MSWTGNSTGSRRGQGVSLLETKVQSRAGTGPHDVGTNHHLLQGLKEQPVIPRDPGIPGKHTLLPQQNFI